MKYVIFYVLFLGSSSVSAQNLYLKMNDALPREIAGEWQVPLDEPTSSVYSKDYGYESYICYNELWFSCDNRTTMSQPLPIGSLSNYISLKTIEQVEAEVNGMTVSQVFEWFRGFQNIYIVEILPNGTHIEVNKVELITRNK
jgi:hypothetical protein